MRLPRRLPLALAVALMAAGPLAGSVGATDHASHPDVSVKLTTYAVAGPGSFATTYDTPLVVASVQGTLVFRNEDIQLHDVVSTQTDASGLPLFSTPLIGLNRTAVVQGLSSLTPKKKYPFYCTIHPGMHGTLETLP